MKCAAAVQHAIDNSPCFAGLMTTALANAGVKPLQVVCYFDEIEPAYPLKKDDREMLAIYWSFADFWRERTQQRGRLVHARCNPNFRN